MSNPLSSTARCRGDAGSSLPGKRTSPRARILRSSNPHAIAATVLLVDTAPEERSPYATALTTVADRVCAAATFAQAKVTLLKVRPDVLVTQVRLGEFNGIHLALWGRGQLPNLRSVIIGQSDPKLEADAHASGFTFVRHNDVETMLQATLETLKRDNPRRRWLRKHVASGLVARIDGKPAQVMDVSYGGFRVQAHAPFRAEVDRVVALDIPALGIRTDAICRWVTAPGGSGPHSCAAAVNELDIRAGSRWRFLVDALSSAS